MYTAWFRFYEELNDILPEEKRKIRFSHHFSGRVSIKDIIESLGVPHSEIDLILVNGISVDFNYIVKDGDNISVYPVFESLDISSIIKLRPAPLRIPKFIADVHLGKLARYLRMLGIDTFYQNDISGDRLIEASQQQQRAILSRSRQLLKRNEITHAYLVRSENPFSQAREVINRFDLKSGLKLFSRCMECNGELSPVSKEDVIDQIPPKVRASQEEFFRCSNCRRIYWKGTHYKEMEVTIHVLLE